MISSNCKSKKKYHSKKNLQFTLQETKKKKQQQGCGKLLENLGQLITSSIFFNDFNKTYKILNSQDKVLVKTQRNKKHYDIINKKKYTVNFDQYGTVIMTELNSKTQQFSYWVYLESDECLINLKYSELTLDNSISSKKNTKKIPIYKYNLFLSRINDYNEKSSNSPIFNHSNSDQSIKNKFKPIELIDSQDTIDLDLERKLFEEKKKKN